MNDDVQKRNSDRNGRGLFYGVIAIAVFIIMAVGATFAYFTATTNSGSNDIQTGSTTLQLKYISYGAGWMNQDLIPADTNIVEYSFENQNDTTITDVSGYNNALCKDDYGNSICSVYVFQVYNDANSPQNVSIDVISEDNGFYSLNAMAYELTISTDAEQLALYNSTENNNGTLDPLFRKGNEESDVEGLINVVNNNGDILNEGTNIKNNQYTPVYVNRVGVVKTLLTYVDSDSNTKFSINRKLATVDVDNLREADNNYPATDANKAQRTVTVASNIEIGHDQVKTFALVLYIKNEDNDQTRYDAAKRFSGQVVVGSGDGSTGVSGSISAVLNDGVVDNLQSNTQTSQNP